MNVITARALERPHPDTNYNQGKASQRPGKDIAGSVTMAQVEEIAKVKMPDLNANDMEAAKLQVAGTARSMGITVVG